MKDYKYIDDVGDPACSWQDIIGGIAILVIFVFLAFLPNLRAAFLAVNHAV